jgi:hypothetical protein
MRTSHHQLIAVLLLVACGRPEQPATEVRPEPELRYDGLTGLTVVPGSGQRWWLKSGMGVVDSDAKVVFYDPQPYDDLVALDADRIALIRRNDGFVYRVSTHQLLNRFCYLPGEVEELVPGGYQESFVVGYDAAEDRIYVQPQTFDERGTRVLGAQVGIFRTDLATPLEWQDVGLPDLQAGGIAVESRERIWLGWGSSLYRYDAKARSLGKPVQLEVGEISALAIEGDRLLVLDGSQGKLASLPLASLK